MQYNSKELIQKAKNSLMFITNRPDLVFVRGEGVYLWDSEGRKYFDFIAGWAVNSLGHCHPAMTRALSEQANLLINPSPSFYNVPMIELADLLTEISCMDKVFFANCGAEANEGAVKLARKYGQLHLDGANEIITTWKAFHGRTLSMMAASGKAPWENLYLPKPGGFTRVDFNDIEAMKKAISKKTCAIMLEPVQGEGGVNVADKAYVQELRKLCDDNNILLIFDEVQTGLGRLGYMFAYEYYGIQPDILTLAKGIGGGVPLAALLAKDKFCCFQPGDQGGTYCGNPLVTAVGITVIQEIINGRICEHVRKTGEYLSNQLLKLKSRFSFITDVRGIGLLRAFGLNKEIGTAIVEAGLENQILLNSPNPSTIRFMPALTITEKEIDEGLDILSDILKKFE